MRYTISQFGDSVHDLMILTDVVRTVPGALMMIPMPTISNR